MRKKIVNGIIENSLNKQWVIIDAQKKDNGDYNLIVRSRYINPSPLCNGDLFVTISDLHSSLTTK